MSNDLQIYSQDELAMLGGYEQDNDFGSKDLSYGWLRIAQTNSPQATKGHESYIPGLEAGMFFNSLDGTIYGNQINVVYQKFFHSYSVHEPDGKNKFLRSMTEEEFNAGTASGAIVFMKKGENGFRGKSAWYFGNDIVKDTNNYMVALPDYPDAGVLRLGLGAGAVKHVKTWNTMLSNTFLAPGKKAPKFAFVWKLTLSLETKPDGSYFTIGSGAKTTVEKVGPVPSSFLAQAKAGYDWFQGLKPSVVDSAGHRDDEDNPL